MSLMYRQTLYQVHLPIPLTCLFWKKNCVTPEYVCIDRLSGCATLDQARPSMIPSILLVYIYIYIHM